MFDGASEWTRGVVRFIIQQRILYGSTCCEVPDVVNCQTEDFSCTLFSLNYLSFLKLVKNEN